MGVQLYANNAVTTLASPCSDVATSLTLTDGSNFPSPSGGDWFLMTLYQLSGSTESNYEIVKVTARSSNVVTVVRAFEDATRFPARSFTAGDYAELRMTAASKGLASQITNVPAGNIAATDVQAAIAELDSEKIATSTKDASGGVVGLTTWKINFRNAANTFTSFFVNAATAARTYTFQDRDGTIADDTDLATKQSTSSKDATGGYVGMTLFKINFKNALNTFTSFFTNANTAARTYTFQDRDGTIADDTDLGTKQSTSAKDATGGYAGLTLFKINFKNVANTFTSFFTNSNSAARTYTFPDKDGTVAMTSDITGTNSGTNTGDQTITLTGDVTGSGTGSFAATIAASAVTLAKMANMATASVFYRKTAGTGAPEVQTLATLKTDLGLTGTNSGDQTLGSLGAEATANKDATGGYAGLTLYKINFKNVANTFTSFLTNSNTAARTYTFPDYDSTVATVAGTESLTNKSVNKWTFTAPSTAATMTAGGDSLTYTMPIVSSLIASEQLQQNSKSAAYTTVLADANKQIFHPAADTTARTFTIDSNANVAYPIGTAITFVNENAAGTLTIAITTDTMRLAGAGTTGSRTLTANGVATALKITSTSWLISGTNLT